ncbi:hypothetical protein BH23CHL5_BH23CHL5_22680 [soil metagenome]
MIPQGLFKKAANVKYSRIDAESSSQIRLATIEPPVPCNSGRLSGLGVFLEKALVIPYKLLTADAVSPMIRM